MPSLASSFIIGLVILFAREEVLLRPLSNYKCVYDYLFVCFVLFKGLEAANAGTTATVCLLRNSNELVVGHLGDSRAILCRNDQPLRLTTDHTAHLTQEKVYFYVYFLTLRFSEHLIVWVPNNSAQTMEARIYMKNEK